MKKYFICFILIFAFAMQVSADDKIVTNYNLLVGSWRMVSYTVDEVIPDEYSPMPANLYVIDWEGYEIYFDKNRNNEFDDDGKEIIRKSGKLFEDSEITLKFGWIGNKEEITVVSRDKKGNKIVKVFVFTERGDDYL